jgi:ubiquitin-small subunit ribosomal protein S27Ae
MARSKPKNKKPSQVWKKYIEKGNLVERKSSCPKCGPTNFLALHKDRKTCGKCGYTEFNSK